MEHTGLISRIVNDKKIKKGSISALYDINEDEGEEEDDESINIFETTDSVISLDDLLFLQRFCFGLGTFTQTFKGQLLIDWLEKEDSSHSNYANLDEKISFGLLLIEKNIIISTTSASKENFQNCELNFSSSSLKWIIPTDLELGEDDLEDRMAKLAYYQAYNTLKQMQQYKHNAIDKEQVASSTTREIEQIEILIHDAEENMALILKQSSETTTLSKDSEEQISDVKKEIEHLQNELKKATHDNEIKHKDLQEIKAKAITFEKAVRSSAKRFGSVTKLENNWNHLYNDKALIGTSQFEIELSCKNISIVKREKIVSSPSRFFKSKAEEGEISCWIVVSAFFNGRKKVVVSNFVEDEGDGWDLEEEISEDKKAVNIENKEETEKDTWLEIGRTAVVKNEENPVFPCAILLQCEKFLDTDLIKFSLFVKNSTEKDIAERSIEMTYNQLNTLIDFKTFELPDSKHHLTSIPTLSISINRQEVYPSILSQRFHYTSQRYILQDLKKREIKMREIMYEDAYTWYVPSLFMRMRAEEIFELVENTEDGRQRLVLEELQARYNTQALLLEGEWCNLTFPKSGPRAFKPSTAKDSSEIDSVPTNLHAQYMVVESENGKDYFDFVTMGCPATHSLKFKEGGTRKLILKHCTNVPGGKRMQKKFSIAKSISTSSTKAFDFKSDGPLSPRKLTSTSSTSFSTRQSVISPRQSLSTGVPTINRSSTSVNTMKSVKSETNVKSPISKPSILKSINTSDTFNIDPRSASRVSSIGSTTSSISGSDIDFSINPSSEASSFEVAESNIIKQGYMEKRGKFFTGMKKRYFVLTVVALEYYTSPTATKPQGLIPLDSILVVRPSHTGKPSSSIDIVTRERVFVCNTENYDEMISWMNAIKLTIKGKELPHDSIRKSTPVVPMNRASTDSLKVQVLKSHNSLAQFPSPSNALMAPFRERVTTSGSVTSVISSTSDNINIDTTKRSKAFSDEGEDDQQSKLLNLINEARWKKEPVSFSGWVQKQHPRTRKMQSRFMRLHVSILRYFKDEKTEKCQGVVDMKEVFSVKFVTELKTIEIEAKDRVFVFLPGIDNSYCQQWIFQLKKSMNAANSEITSMIPLSMASVTLLNQIQNGETKSVIEDDSIMVDPTMASLRYRLDLATSQSLTGCILSFITRFQILIELDHPQQIIRICKLGFLVQVESLLSTSGNEAGMLEDTDAAMKELRNVKFCLRKQDANADARDTLSMSREGTQIVVFFKFPPRIFEKLPLVARDKRLKIPIIPVLFTQGINEMQTISNSMGDSSLQEEINAESLDLISEYFNRIVKYHTSAEWKLANGIKPTDNETEDVGMHDCAALSQKRNESVDVVKNHFISIMNTTMNNLKEAITSSKANEKNLNILKFSGMLTREMGGGRIICCKSGKDRTGMAVTLEEARLLRAKYGISPSDDDTSLDFTKLLRILRIYGVRLANARKNTGKNVFAFNRLQRNNLPDLYRPPQVTCKGFVES